MKKNKNKIYTMIERYAQSLYYASLVMFTLMSFGFWCIVLYEAQIDNFVVLMFIFVSHFMMIMELSCSWINKVGMR